MLSDNERQLACVVRRPVIWRKQTALSFLYTNDRAICIHGTWSPTQRSRTSRIFRTFCEWNGVDTFRSHWLSRNRDSPFVVPLIRDFSRTIDSLFRAIECPTHINVEKVFHSARFDNRPDTPVVGGYVIHFHRTHYTDHQLLNWISAILELTCRRYEILY